MGSPVLVGADERHHGHRWQGEILGCDDGSGGQGQGQSPGLGFVAVKRDQWGERGEGVGDEHGAVMTQIGGTPEVPAYGMQIGAVVLRYPAQAVMAPALLGSGGCRWRAA